MTSERAPAGGGIPPGELISPWVVDPFRPIEGRLRAALVAPRRGRSSTPPPLAARGRHAFPGRRRELAPRLDVEEQVRSRVFAFPRCDARLDLRAEEALHLEVGSTGAGALPQQIQPGELFFFGSGRRFRVLDVVPFDEEDESHRP